MYILCQKLAAALFSCSLILELMGIEEKLINFKAKINNCPKHKTKVTLSEEQLNILKT